MSIQTQKTFIPAEVRSYVLDRDAYCCQNSECKNRYYNLTIHHIITRARGGSGRDPCNLVTLCWNCHSNIDTLKKRLPNLKDLDVVKVEDLVHRDIAVFHVFYSHNIKPIKCSHYGNNRSR